MSCNVANVVAREACIFVFFDIHVGHFAKASSAKRLLARLTEHDDVITPLLRGASRLGLAWAPYLLGQALHIGSSLNV